MSRFKNICLLKAPQYLENFHSSFSSDLTELCYLAAAVQDIVETVSIPADYFNKNIFNSLHAFLKTHPCDMVAISSMTGAYSNALRLATIAKQHNKFVVMGGYHPSALPEDVLRSYLVDAVVIGEGEVTFRELVAQGPGASVAGLAYLENGQIVFTEVRPLIEDLDALPMPLRSIRPVRVGNKGADYAIDTFYSSRGCPWSCTFCANKLVNKRWRARSPENVVEELSLYHNPKRKKTVKFWDANFLTDIRRVEKICELMLERNLTNFKIWTETRAGDIVRAEKILPIMKRVGFGYVALGIESPNVKTLELMKKKNNLGEVAQAITLLYRHQIKSQGYFIIGHYSESIEDTKAYPVFIDSLQKLGLRERIFMIMTPYPGTAIYDEYRRENRIRSFDWDQYNNFCPVVETQHMSMSTIKSMHAYCLGTTNPYYTLQRKGVLSIIAYLFLNIAIVTSTLRADKDNEGDALRDLVFEVFRFADGKRFSLRGGDTSSRILKHFHRYKVRITRSPGKHVDFIIAHKDGTRELSVEKACDSSPVKGFVIDLDKVIGIVDLLFPDKFIYFGYAADAMANNPERRFRELMPLLKVRGLSLPLFRLVSLYVRILVRGLFSLLHAPARA